MGAVSELSEVVGTQAACEVLGLPRASFYRQQRPIFGPPQKAVSARALSLTERANVLACLHEERFQDRSPAAVFATLLDEGVYHCSLRTMYRILDEAGETGERRDQLTHPAYQKPELLATGPNQLWSWDITKLKGHAKWTYFYLYVILDVFQPLRGRLDGGASRNRGVGQAADCRHLRQAEHPAGSADHPRRSRLLDDVQAGGIPAGRLERHQIAQSALRFR